MRLPTILLAGLLFAPGAARAADTYPVDRWPQDVDSIPCSAWDHNSGGSWSLRGYVKLGASVIDNVGFSKGESWARLLDKKCGKK